MRQQTQLRRPIGARQALIDGDGGWGCTRGHDDIVADPYPWRRIAAFSLMEADDWSARSKETTMRRFILILSVTAVAMAILAPMASGATLTCRKTGGDGTPMTYKLSDVLISS